MDRRYLTIPEGLSKDPRLLPVRNGVAASYLKGKSEAQNYHDGVLHHVIAPVCVLKREASEEAGADTQLVYGESFTVYGEEKDWAWGLLERDSYVGWVKKSYLKEGAFNATHHIMSRGTFLYKTADLKSRPLMKIPMSARLEITGEETVRGTKYLKSNNGWVIARHARKLDEYASDFVMVGESMVGLTYLWGGCSTFGIDCSGFIQLSLQMAGIAALRDTDMQEQTLGEEIELKDDLSGLKRGDIIFWPGHVGMMQDEQTILHANGHTMTVFSEPLKQAVDRIAYLYNKPRTVRRLFGLGIEQ